MIRFIVFALLALHGCSASYDPTPSGCPTEETEFWYHSTMGVGVATPRQSWAGSVLDMKIVIDRKSDCSALVTFSEVKTRDYNQVTYLGDDPPDVYEGDKPVPELEGTFLAYFQRETGTVMDVPATDKLWVTNIRKAIVGLLKVPPYLGTQMPFNMQTNSIPAERVYGASIQDMAYFRREYTFAGYCNVSYTMVPDYADGEWPGASDSALPTGGPWYRLRRTVDFDSCHDAVKLDKTSFGNFTGSHRTQFLDVQDRSADGEYLFRDRGDGFFDLKGARFVSNQFTKPFGQDMGRVRARTNQTLALTRVASRSERTTSQTRPSARGEMKSVTTWYHQFVSPASPSDNHKADYIIYENKPGSFVPVVPEYAILGVELIPQAELLDGVKKQLEEIVKIQQEDNVDYPQKYNGTQAGRIVHLMNQMAHAMKGLTVDSVKQLYQYTEDQSSMNNKIRRQTFLDASITSGSAAAISVFVENAKAQKIDNMRIGGLMAQMVNNIYDPEVIKPVMDWVLTLDPEQHGIYLTTMAYLNFAHLANRVCVNWDVKTYAIPHKLLGAKNCERSVIEQQFMPQLKTKIENASNNWEKIMYTLSLGNLGLDSTVPYLKDIVLGKKGKIQPLQIGAIRAMVALFNEKANKYPVMDALLPIVEAHAMEHPIREAAFIAVIQSRPNSTVLQRLAMSTWMEPSNKMLDIIYSAFVSMAQSDLAEFENENHMARVLLPTMKPAKPSMSSSLFFDYKTWLPDYKIGAEFKTAWIKEYNSPLAIPRKMLNSIKGHFGGVEVPLIEFFTQYDSSVLRSSRSQSSNPRDSAQRGVQSELQAIYNALDQSMATSDKSIYAYTSFMNYQFFLPYDKETQAKIKQEVLSYLQRASRSRDLPWMPEGIVKFFNPTDIYVVLPTPFGVPTELQMATPNHWLWDYKTEVQYNHPVANITVDGRSLMTMKTQSLINIQIPWLTKVATAGFDTEATFSMTGKMSIEQNNTYPFPISKAVFTPNHEQEKPILFWRNKPLTVLRAHGPLGDITAPESPLVTPIANVTHSYNATYELSKDLLGLKGRFTFQGDIDYPFQQATAMDIYHHPERLLTMLTCPTPHDFTWAYRLNIRDSETKNISVAGVFDYGYHSSQVPDSRTSLKQIGERINRRTSLIRSPEVRATEAKRGELGDFLISFSVNYTAPNIRTRQYEFVMTGSNFSDTKPKMEELVVINFLRNGTTGSREERKTCIINEVVEEKQPPTSSGQYSPLYTTINADIYAGKQCSEKEKVVNMDARLYFSTDDRNIVRPLPSSSGMLQSGLLTNPSERMPFTQDGLYDRANIEFTKLMTFPEYYQNVSYWVSDMSQLYMFPYLTKNRVVEPNKPYPETKHVINVTRNMASSTLDIWVHDSHKICHIEGFPAMPIIDWASPLLGSRRLYHHALPQSFNSMTLGSSPNTLCQVKPQQVETFDGVQYQKQPSSCWTAAALVYHQDDSFSILTKQAEHSPSSQQKIKILAPSIAKIEIESPTLVKVNDAPVRQTQPLMDSRGRTVGTLQFTSNTVKVSVPEKFEVTLEGREQMQIKLARKYTNEMKGLCGDYNGDRAQDLKTPRGCRLSAAQGPIFAASWTARKDQCADSAMTPQIQQAQEFERRNCARSVLSTSRRNRRINGN